MMDDLVKPTLAEMKFARESCIDFAHRPLDRVEFPIALADHPVSLVEFLRGGLHFVLLRSHAMNPGKVCCRRKIYSHSNGCFWFFIHRYLYL